MAKKLELTERLKALITAAAGDEIDFTQISAYEAVAASTRPINQAQTAYHGAVMSESLLREMALAYESESVPIQVMHNGSMLPVGKVFYAEVLSAEEGHSNLNTLFYVDINSEYARKIDLGILDEVSVGAIPDHAFCSECDFDYMAEGNEYSFYFRECDNGHAIGENGTHLRLTSLRAWKELSLVNKGASNKPKILGSAKQRLSKDTFNQLAASVSTPQALEFSYLSCSPNETPTTGDPMELTALTEKVSTLSAANGKLENKLEVSVSSLEAANSQIATLKTTVEELNTKISDSSETQLSAQVETLTGQLSEADKIVKAFDAQIKLAATAAGLELSEEATAEEKIALLDAAQIKLAAIPRGGVSKEAQASEEQNFSLSAAQNSVFVLNK